MFRYIIFFSALVLSSSCATKSVTIAPLSPDLAQNFSRGKITVVFIDSSKTLNYIIEIYEVLNTTQRTLSSTYRDDWENDIELTELHTRQFAKQGFKVRMFTEIYSKADFNKVKLMHSQYLKDKKTNPNIKITLTKEIKTLLSERRIDHLVLIDWTGYTLLIKSQGLPAEEYATLNYKIFNSKSGNEVWNAAVQSKISIDLKERDGKVYLEKDEFAQFKLEVNKLILSQYTRNKDNIWQLMGIENNASTNN
jgi:hypothetical protein